ncbi:MAG: GNAT family N-acetyltransferase [Clostridia bacterium]|nr:GNAT family N-acetyltransferase [Clostridia bacterium]
MPKYTVRTMKLSELKGFYQHIKKDFLPGEYAPYAVLYQQLQNGVQEGLVLCDRSRDLAYAICAAGNENGYVLISLLAVLEDYRGQGIGTAFMKKLHEIYRHKQAIIVEVEKPELSETPEELDDRNGRIAFYERLGYHLIPGIDYSIWDVPMHLMALPISISEEIIDQKIGEIMHRVYLGLMGEQFIHKMQLSVKE